MFQLNMQYNILGEILSCILSAIICFNVSISLSPYERRHRLFLYSCVGCFLVSLFDILALVAISYISAGSLYLSLFVTSVYFFVVPLVPVAMLAYTLEIAFTYRQRNSIISYVVWASYLVYTIILLINVKSGWLFYFNSDYEYVPGKLVNLTYLYKLVVMIVIEVVAVINKKYMSLRLYIGLSLYPIIATLVLWVQFIFPEIRMSGFSSLCAVLLAYVTIQNDMAEYDFLTGLMTQHKLEKHVETKQQNSVLFMISIENLNTIQINMEVEKFNHLLIKIAKEFRKRFERKSYFISSNKFAAIAKNMETVKKFSDEITDILSNLHLRYEMSIPFPLEFYSVAEDLPVGEKSFSTVMEIANSLVSKAKEDNSRQLIISDESVLMERERRRYLYKILEREMHVDSEEFIVYYQPIYSIKDEKFTYMEALARLHNTEIGNIPPSEFVPAAENHGLIEQLGNVVFEKVCKFISENQDVVNAVSVNFSVYQIINPNIVDYVMGKIREYNLKPSNIIMEITESIFIENFEIAYKNMISLAASGIKFYLDDFGTGYSNLANVIGLPFSTVKMDRSLVLMMEHNEKNFNLFSNLVSTFKGADLNVLVEGVETQKQNELVFKAKADYIQGYLYSRPLSPEKCIELLKQNKKS